MMDQFEMCLALRKKICEKLDELNKVCASMTPTGDEDKVRALLCERASEIGALAEFGAETGMIPVSELSAYTAGAKAIAIKIDQIFAPKKVRKGSDLGQDFPELSAYIGKLAEKEAEFRQEFDELLIAYEQSFKFIFVLKASGVNPEFYDLPLELGRRAEHMLRVAHCDGLINREERNELFSQIEEIKLANRSVIC